MGHWQGKYSASSFTFFYFSCVVVLKEFILSEIQGKRLNTQLKYIHVNSISCISCAASSATCLLHGQ